MSQELTVAQHSELQQYGTRNQIRELGERLRKLMPGSQRFTEEEALSVAQIAIAHDLNPFNGEVWGLKGDNNKWYGVMVGIKALRKKAREQAKNEGGDFWISYHRADPDAYNQPEDVVVYEAHLRDSVSFGAWSKSYIEILKAIKDQPDEIKKPLLDALGEPPIVYGIGIAKPSEHSKMEIHTRAKKRAEADAIKQRYDISFKGVSIDYEQLEQNGEIIESTIREVGKELGGQVTEITELTESELIKQLGFD